MADLNGERLTILAGGVDDSWMYYSPDISPDGKTVVFIRADDVGAELCTIRLDGSHLTVLAEGRSILRPQLSPNGQWLLFYRDSAIWVIRPDGTDLNQLTYPQSKDAHATWSNDGRSVIFVSQRNGGMDLYELTLPQSFSGN